MYPELLDYVEGLQGQLSAIPADRKDQLLKLAGYIEDKLNSGAEVNLTFICTHNSRRSHMAQLWMHVAAEYYGKAIHTYSGGTEATTFNPRAVSAMRKAGFHIENQGGENPAYEVRISDDYPPMICFSKTFDHPANPVKEFAAVMTCSDADEECPFVPGAEFRIPITYEDPKASDGTENESAIYEERSRQIAGEMLFVISMVK